MKRFLGFLLAGLTAGCAAHAAPASEGADAGGSAIPKATAVFGSFTSRVHATGRVGAPAGSESKLAFAIPGIVQSVDVRVGDAVTAGQALMALDTRGLAIDARTAQQDAAAAAQLYAGGSVGAAGVASARAKLAAAQSRLQALQSGSASASSDAVSSASAVRASQAKVDADQRALDRAERLFAGGVAAAKDVEAARTTLALDRGDLDANVSKQRSTQAGVGGAIVQARADVRQAQSDLNVAEAAGPVAQAQAGSAAAKYAQAQRLLANGVLRAPNDGIVLQILKHAGESTDATTPAVVVGPSSDRTITLAVSGTDGADVHAGESVDLRITARGLHATGIVRTIVPAVDPTTQSATVVVQGVPAGAAAGDAVDATIVVGTKRGVVVPTSAIVQDPQTGNTLVFVFAKQKDGSTKPVSRTVTLGPSDARSTLVASGLHAGETLAAQGAFDLLAPAGGG